MDRMKHLAFFIQLLLASLCGAQQHFEVLDEDLDEIHLISHNLIELSDTSWCFTLSLEEEYKPQMVWVTQHDDQIKLERYELSELGNYDLITIKLIDIETEDRLVGVAEARNKEDSSYSILDLRLTKNGVSDYSLVWQYPADSLSIITSVNSVQHSFARVQIASRSFPNYPTHWYSIIEYDWSLEKVLNVREISVPGSQLIEACSEAPNGDVYFSLFQFGRLFRLKDNSDVIDTVWVGEPDSLFSKLRYSASIRDIEFQDGSILLNGESRIDRDLSLQYTRIDRELFYYKLDTNGVLKTETYLGKFDTLDVQGTVFKHLDDESTRSGLILNEDKSMFITGSANFDNVDELYLNDVSWISLNKLDESGNLVWSKYYGDSDSSRFINLNSLGLSDGGVLLVSLKYNWKEKPENFTDLHVMRIKPDGEVYALGEESIILPISSLNVYPNPSPGRVQISGVDFSEVISMEVIDIMGKRVKLLPISRTQDLSDLDSGVYLLKLSLRNGQIFSEKVIKR